MGGKESEVHVKRRGESLPVSWSFFFLFVLLIFCVAALFLFLRFLRITNKKKYLIRFFLL